MVFYTLSGLLELAALAQGAYSSFKALSTASQAGEESLETARASARILMFWVVLAFLSIHEQFTESLVSWIPLYYPMKCLLLGGLLAPHFKLSRWFFKQVVVPVVEGGQAKLTTTVWPVVASRMARWTRVAHATGVSLYLHDMHDTELQAWERTVRQSLVAIETELGRRQDTGVDGGTATPNSRSNSQEVEEE